MAKENEYRFSITLNRNDPLHRTAINALNAQGRRKSQFIVNAITNYIMEKKGTEALKTPDRAYIEEICRDVYQTMQLKQPVVIQDSISRTDDVNETDNCEFDENMGFIAETLNSFSTATAFTF